ncbi:hypothetical protein CVU75_02515, partial [Candidatus Dependentiae bacterium HGW-Dependentiae-1]
MNLVKKCALLLTPLILCSRPSQAFDLIGNSFFMPRSQSVDAARELTGWHPYINKYNQHEIYGAFTVNPVYTQSVRPERIAQALFGTNVLQVSGSEVLTRGPNDWLADYFGLAPTFHSLVNIKPMIRNALVDFNFYLGRENWYIRAHVPGVWTQWSLGLDEQITGTNTLFPAGYMSTGAVYPGANSFIQAMQGETKFGQMKSPLNSGKICGKQTAGGFAEMQLAVGWNFINQENGHAGLNIRGSIPSGTRPKGEFLFEPVVGNGRHPELGIGFTGHVLIWEKDGEQELSFFTDINLTHQFKARQCRSFDFCASSTSCTIDRCCAPCCTPGPCGSACFTDKSSCSSERCCRPNFCSRYILLKEFDTSGNYTNNLIPAVNVTTRHCDVSVDFQADFAAMFGYTYNGLVVDVGYNGWLRSKEKISIASSLPANTYALKGIQNVAAPDTQKTQSSTTIHGNLLHNQNLVAD